MKKKQIYELVIVLICFFILIYSSISNVLKKETKQPDALYLYGDLSEMNTKQDVRSITAVFNSRNSQNNCYATIKIQGTSSLAYDKKNYTIQFFEDAECQSAKNIDVGWGEESKYCLKANWIDKTHCRNVVTAKLATEVQEKYNILNQAPCNGLVDGFPVAVYVNDEFHGIYTWNIPKSAWMFGMDEENVDHIVLCGEDWSDTVCFKASPDLTSWSVEVGLENEETLSKYSRVMDFVMNSSDEKFKECFNQYMDLDAALNYYILVDFAYLPDNCGKNMLMATYDGSIWYPSLYDLDTSWGTHWGGLDLLDYENSFVNFSEVSRLAQRLEKNFSKELHNRYFELRETILTKEHVMDMFYTFDSQISDEIKAAEVARWGNDIPGYDLTQIESYLDSMIPRLDERYENMSH